MTTPHSAHAREAADGITVIGVGRSATAVDTVTINLSAVAIHADAGQAFSAAAHTARHVLRCVSERGVPADQVRTRTVSLGPHYQPGPTQAPSYQARHLLTVTTTGMDGVEELLTDLVRAGRGDGDPTQRCDPAPGGAGSDRPARSGAVPGGSVPGRLAPDGLVPDGPAQTETGPGVAEVRGEVQIEGVELAAGDSRQAQSTARTAAMIDAREKALSLAALAGRPLGPVCSVHEVEPSAGASPLMVREVAAASSMPIASGDETVSVAVQVRFSWAD